MMINGRRVIGVCITKICDISRVAYINNLYEFAKKQDFKLILFNSFVDFYNNDSFDEGAKSIYNFINYSMLDALIIHSESFCSRSVVDEIISVAKLWGVPVVLINGLADGCFSVVNEYKDAFKYIINHVIKDHGVTDHLFMAGYKDNDEVSQKRIECYKEALEENGLEFDESKIAYGNYWSDPAKIIVRDILEGGGVPPKAFICANDAMALAVCEKLKEYGYRVPDDVIVTGFDNISISEYSSPRLTTCAEDIEGLARLSLDAVAMALDKKDSCTLINKYIPCIYESCGCEKLDGDHFRSAAADLCQTFIEMESHEDYTDMWINRMIGIKSVDDLYSSLSESIIENSCVCLNRSFLNSIMNGKRVSDMFLSDEFVVISSNRSCDEANLINNMKLSNMIPNADEWAADDTLYILSAVYVEDEVYGYYALKTDNLQWYRHKIKRTLNTINIAFNVIANHFRQENMRQSIEKAALTNSITELPNLRGSIKWFGEFSSEENQKKPLTVSVYGIPKYTYILENYGLSAVEDAVRFVAESLKLANPQSCFIGHIADDEFVVINDYADENDISDTIKKATSIFFNIIGGYNTNSDKEYYVEVNCGCTVVNPGWSGDLESFIKFANSEMYMNRLKSKTGSAIKEQTVPKEHYNAFKLLIEQNLFHYHFQPIVSAKNGDIYAYEALMRTDGHIGMSPADVLNAAAEYNKLYDIEKATLFNVMERYSSEREKFGDRKVFINLIPGHFLNDEDHAALISKYGGYMDNFVFEITEQNSVSEDELLAIKHIKSKNSVSYIAIDDYGTGHSNIVNLMRYTPQVIKIDRFLISNIHKDQNKQLFVRSTIDFARLNKIMVLAEGVETSSELNTVIDLGVDLIQGFYTGRPALDPIPFIAEDVHKEIIEANPLFGQNK